MNRWRRLLGRLLTFDLNGAVLEQRDERPDCRKDRGKQCADDTCGEWEFRDGAALVLDNHSPHVAFTNQRFEPLDERLPFSFDRFPAR